MARFNMSLGPKKCPVLRTIKKLTTVLFLVILVVLAISTDASRATLSALRDLNLDSFILLTVLFLIARILQGITLINSLAANGRHVTLLESFDLSVLKMFYNQIVPSSGVFAQFLTLKKRLNIPAQDFIAAQYFQITIQVTLLGLIMAGMGVSLPIGNNLLRGAMVVGGFALALSPFVTLLGANVALQRLPSKIAKNIVDQVGKTSDAIGANVSIAVWLLLVRALFVLSRVIRLWVLALLVDSSVDLHVLSGATIVAEVAILVPITPGGVGLRESVIAAAGGSIGMVDVFLAAALIDRGFALAFNTLFGLLVVTKNHIGSAGAS